MDSTRNHEQELAEVKELTTALDRSLGALLERIEEINAGLEQELSARGLAPAARPRKRRRRRRDAEKPETAGPSDGGGDEPREPEATPSKRKPSLPSRVRARLRSAVFGPDIEISSTGAGGSLRATANGDAPAPLLAFVHIPKTAGGTVASMFASAYSRAAVHSAGNYMSGPESSVRKVSMGRKGWSRWQATGGKVTIGHVPYAVLHEHLPADTRYMTFLREPVDRVISHYYRHIHRRDPKRAGSPKELARGRVKANSLEEAMTEMSPAQLNNLQTRFLSNAPPLGDLPPTALDEAKENLRAFAFVGLQERFGDSMTALRELLDIEEVEYVDRHVSSDRPTFEEVPEEHRELIADRNQLDIALYEFAVELFEERVATGAQ